MTANATTAAAARATATWASWIPRGEFLQGLFIPLTICGLRDQAGRSLRLGINSQDGGPGFVVGIVVRGNDEGGHRAHPPETGSERRRRWLPPAQPTNASANVNAGDDQAAPERPSLQFAASRAFVSHLVGDTGIEGMLTSNSAATERRRRNYWDCGSR